MSNPANHGLLIGRVSQDIREFPNADGSKVLAITLAVDDDFFSGKGENRKIETNYVPIRAFIGKDVQGRGSWDRVGNGDQIAINTRIVAKSYMKDGERVFPAPTIEADGFPKFLESKQVTEARAAKKAVAAAAATEATEETPDQQIARLQAQLEAARAQEAATSPFAGAAA